MSTIDQTRERAAKFSSMHKQADPLILFNCWDVTTAKISAKYFPAVGTSSGAVAFSQGLDDGENISLDFVLPLFSRITGAVDCPVTVDFEAGYSEDPKQVAVNVQQLISRGIVGLNLEDGLFRGDRVLVPAEEHAAKIAAIRDLADSLDLPFFVNVRVDTFIVNPEDQQGSYEETLRRAEIYAEAGASGIFVPVLSDPELIAKMVDRIDLPLNLLLMRNTTTLPE